MGKNVSKNFSNILKGIIISIICTLIFLFIYSVILAYTNISESFTNPVIIIITAISIFIGSSIANLKMQKNGILNGALIGGLYLMIIYLLSSIINGVFIISMQSIIIIVSGMICGIVGGIIGINKK